MSKTGQSVAHNRPQNIFIWSFLAETGYSSVHLLGLISEGSRDRTTGKTELKFTPMCTTCAHHVHDS